MKRRFGIGILSFIILLTALGNQFVFAQEEDSHVTEVSDEIREQNLREMGGFYLETKNWNFYSDADHDNHLYAVHTDTGEKIEITDFMAANLCIVGDTIYFTDVSMSIIEGDECYDEITRMFYGGKLYCIPNVSEMSTEPVPEQIGVEGMAYYQLSPGEGCLYALVGDTSYEGDGTDWIYAKLDSDGNTIGSFTAPEEEIILNAIAVDGYLYLEIQRMGENEQNDGYIMKADRDHGTGAVTYLHGQDLHVYGDYIFFISTEDSYLYAIKRGEEQAQKISLCKLMSYEIEDGGYILAVFFNRTTQAVISQEEGLNPFYYSRVFKVGAWFNYVQGTDPIDRKSPPPPPKTDSAITDEDDTAGKEKGGTKNPGQVIKTGITGKPPEKKQEPKSPEAATPEPTSSEPISPDPTQTDPEDTTPDPGELPGLFDNEKEENSLAGGTGVGTLSGKKIVNRANKTPEPEVIAPVGATDPGIAIDMLYTLLKGEGLEAPIFDVYSEDNKNYYITYYDKNEKRSVQDMNLTTIVEKLVGELLGGEGFSEAQSKKVQETVSQIASAVTYSREVIQMDEDGKSAYVRVHVTRMFDTGGSNFSNSQLRTDLIAFFGQSDYSQSDLYGSRKNDLIIDFMIYELPKMIPVVDMDYTFDIHCTKDDVLGWVAEPGDEPGKGANQIFSPEKGGLMTGERNSNDLTFEDLQKSVAEKKRLDSYRGVKACKLRRYIQLVVGQDRETIEQYIWRKLSIRNKKNENIVYRKYVIELPIGDNLPGYRECKDITIQRIDMKPQRDYLTKWKNNIKDFFISRWKKYTHDDANGDFVYIPYNESSMWGDFDRLYNGWDYMK